jgi:predicted kinase
MPIGIPGCGKSHYWDTKISKIPNCYKIDEAEVSTFTHGLSSKTCREYILSLLKGYISKSCPVIYWDGLLFSSNLRKDIIAIAKMGNYKIVGIVFDTPLEKCILRCRHANKSYSPIILESMYNIFRREEPEYDEGFDDILIIKE